MIVKILSAGKSFSGLATYLTHDPNAQTDERVGWTHTLNLAHDHVPSAVDEMLWTARQAELLKQEAGMRAGGRPTENAVKHVSLNWAPDETPTRDHMIETAEGFLRHMNWQEHQALLVAHEDKAHSHVHLMLNRVHPDTGLALDENFERRRAQAWALGYEREQGRIYCEQRLLDPAEREDAPTRPAWMAFTENQKSFIAEEKSRREKDLFVSTDFENAPIRNDEAWKKLKEFQKKERITFFEDGKSAFSDMRNSVYREVRAEFRERWADFYQSEKRGMNDEICAARKAELIDNQNRVLEKRRNAACQQLLESRQETYQALLESQRDARHGLHTRQEAGFDNALFLQFIAERPFASEHNLGFRDAARSVVGHQDDDDCAPQAAFTAEPREATTGMKSGSDISVNIATGLGFGLLSIFSDIADGLIGARPAPKRRSPELERAPPGRDWFEAARTAADERQRHAQADEEDEKRRRQGADARE